MDEVLPEDQVMRWSNLLFQYPQASYSCQQGWFYGAFRDDDTPMKRSSLERLIDSLLDREHAAARAHDADARNVRRIYPDAEG